MADKHTITADLSGLKLDDAQFKVVQDAIHRAVLAEVARLPFTHGIGAIPRPGTGGLINGIIVERFAGNQAGIGH